ncbi:hypothetical protein [Paenibacillus cremeus]|uniref:hypothetical protein n=1 Tax=Paenibacillus cremeus TaxID=2163881 RepID=UPI0016448B40|nr:hypothetical protein [Paenibacillus cremeus]
MLSDIGHKILRIIANLSALRKYTPNIEALEFKTGRDRQVVMKVLAVLAREQYIEWSEKDPDYIQLLEVWERKPLYDAKLSPPFKTNTSPFMNWLI